MKREIEAVSQGVKSVEAYLTVTIRPGHAMNISESLTDLLIKCKSMPMLGVGVQIAGLCESSSHAIDNSSKSFSKRSLGL